MRTLAWLIFGGLAGIYLAICAYFWVRFFRTRRIQSALCGILPLGWVLAVALRMKVCPAWLEAALLALAYTVGALSVAIILLKEMQK